MVDLFVERLHALLGQGAGVRDRLLRPCCVGHAVEHATVSEPLLEFRILGIVRQLGLFLGVQATSRLPKNSSKRRTVGRNSSRSPRGAAELAGGVAKWFEHFSDGRVFLCRLTVAPGTPTLVSARADRVLAGDKAGAAGSATLLGV